MPTSMGKLKCGELPALHRGINRVRESMLVWRFAPFPRGNDVQLAFRSR
ncbi:hypothetical protein RBSH_06039 [Rhodopirellula baltica SH28]|uniref:Uncharacterized protein n=1 Tax=Rhodopirellula baltica SH28 TaxID=993517 RepID=K5DYQ1_RHOBT|nr:hypothetical protein RBSH_06039 [Rhodopirellula baltica SH28]